MELAVIANETHQKAIAYFTVAEQFSYKFLMEVKKIRDERLYKELGFTSFDSYCEAAWKVKRGYMDDRILLADSFGNDFDRMYGQLGHSKSLLLARMDPEIREKIETTVDVNETTVRQLKQLEKSLQEAERRAAAAEATALTEKEAARHFEKLWQQAKNQQPKVVKETVTVNVLPPDYEELKSKQQRINNENIELHRANQQLVEQLSELKSMDNIRVNVREMNRCFKEMISQINALHSMAKMSYQLLPPGSAEGYRTIDAFLKEFDRVVATVFQDWKENMEIQAS